MRLFVTGDVHGQYDYRKMGDFRKAMKGELTLEDAIVVCGDFGILWEHERQDRYFKNHVYGDFPCTIMWVCGNHENFDALYTYPTETWHGGQVHRITDRIVHLKRGEIFTLPTHNQPTKILAFGGAMSTDRGYDTKYQQNWWPQELPSQEEKENALKNLNLHQHRLDYIFTHDAPQSVQRELFGEDVRQTDPDFNGFLEQLSQEVDFKAWYFGHHHKESSGGKFHCLYHTVLEL